MDPRVETAIALIKAYPTRKFTVCELAHKVNLSHWYFSHLFFEELRVSPSQYSRRLRFEMAKSLLETSFLSVKQIMAKVGINDKSHFARDFRSIYGCSPRECRFRSATKSQFRRTAN